MNSPFVCLKLKTGETLFAELKVLDPEFIEIRYPMQVKIIRTTTDAESLSLVNWIPFTDDVEFDIPTNHIIYVGPINDSYIKFYGSSRIKDELSKLQSVAFRRIYSGENKKEVLQETKHEFEELIKEYSIKFGFNPEKLTNDLSGLFSEDLTEQEEITPNENPTNVTYH